jgi:uncharacterized membrane protein YeaQ/YmgE (transglycosylase-associated protein family)
MDLVTWLAWLVVGVLTGWLVAVLWTSNIRRGWLLDLIVGILGAVAGGWLFYAIAVPGTTAFNIWSLLVAFIGAIVLLGLLRLLAFSRPTVA